MVRGIDVFREHFRPYTNQFILIGGAACDLLYEESGLQFRATKDMDIVLCLESLDSGFTSAFWEFIRSGSYEMYEESSGHPRFYRFKNPKRDDYPYMLELFSRGPGDLPLPEGRRFTRIPVEEEVSSLSAILIDREYYRFLRDGTKIVSGIPVVGPEHLIPLKARAFLDLRNRRAEGGLADRRDITKHKNDVFRLLRIIDPDLTMDIPLAVQRDMQDFLLAMATDNVDLPALGFDTMTKEAALADLRGMYCP